MAFKVIVAQSVNKGSDVVYNTWRMHPEWPRLHLIDFMHNYRYFRPEHVCADCAYNALPNKTGVPSHKTICQQLRSALKVSFCE